MKVIPNKANSSLINMYAWLVKQLIITKRFCNYIDYWLKCYYVSWFEFKNKHYD